MEIENRNLQKNEKLDSKQDSSSTFSKGFSNKVELNDKQAAPKNSEDNGPSFTLMSQEYYTQKTNLIIKHIPIEVPEDLLQQLIETTADEPLLELKYWRNKGTAFLKFKTISSANKVLKELNHYKLLNKTLIVEFAKDTFQKNRDKLAKEEEEKSKLGLENISPVPIAPSLGFNYGPSPFLEYKYPPPTHHILTNIYNTLASVPVFYTQVLHLMNKMNLPPPFGSVLPIDPNMKKTLKRKKGEIESEEEESEGEETLEPQNLKKQKLESEQRVAREMTHTVHTPSTKQNVSIRIQIPNSVNISEGKETPKSVSTKEEQKEEEEIISSPISATSKTYIHLEELQKNRKTIDEINQLPFMVNKQYESGEPSQTLFLKNLPKNITKEKLEFVFGRYSSSTQQPTIQVMKKNMRGTAFITLPSLELAIQALNEVNGYLFEQDKPVIIQYQKPK